MKIIQLTYSLSSGGAEHFVVDLCNQLSKDKDNEIYLLTLCNDKIQKNRHYYNELSNDIHYINVGAKSGFTWKSFIMIYKIIRRINPDIVHAHFSIILLYFVSFFLRKPVYFHTQHNLPSACLRFKVQKYINLFFFKRKYIYPITISRECHKEFFQIYNHNYDVQIDNGRSPVMPTKDFDSVKKEVNAFKSSKDDTIFVHVARYAPQKNQQMLFDVFTKLIDDGFNIQLIVIGAGYNNETFSIQIKESSRIHILGEKNNVGDYLMNADYFVLTSLYEGLPLTLLEAMSVGCIPICTPVGGIVDVIENFRSGYLSKSIEANDFYYLVKEILNQKNTINKKYIITKYNENFSMKQCTKKYYDLFKSKLNNKKP